MAPQLPQLPKPEEVMGALASFPPKLSVLMKPLAAPEEIFESTIRTAGVEIPPGPVKLLTSFMESFEEAAPPSIPGLPSPAPGTQTTPSTPPATQTKTQTRTGKTDVEVF